MKMDEIIFSKTKISVIIPMFNCEAFVNDILSTVSNQTLEDFEAICIIDGSTDRTEELVKEHCKRDKRFFYVYQKNGGAGKARNTGLDIAKGKYILFLDADDEYSLNMLKELYTMAEKRKADITICSFSMENFYDKTILHELGFNKNIFAEKDSGNAMETKTWMLSILPRLTNKLYRRELINEYGLRCSETRACNDVFFDFAHLMISNKTAVVRKDLLVYRRQINPDSITSKRGDYADDIITVFHQLWDFMEKYGLESKYTKIYCCKFIYSLYYEIQFDYNQLFVEEAARTLSKERPWKDIGSRSFTALFGKILSIDNLEAQKKEAEETLKNESPATSESYIKFTMLQNQIRSLSEIKRICKELYGKTIL